MKIKLTEFQRQLCNLLQAGLPVCARPFEAVAAMVNSDEETVLQEVRRLMDCRLIRRFSVLVNYRATGAAGTLATAHVPQEYLPAVIDAVNSIEGVSHNYLRQHHYNLWFTLQAESPGRIDKILSDLSVRFGMDFKSLPVERTFKLDVRFDAEDRGQVLLRDVDEIPEEKPVELDKIQKEILVSLQGGLEIVPGPFDFLCGGGLKLSRVLQIIKELIDKKVIRRIAAIVDHRMLGFTANVLFACEVSQDRVTQIGSKLAEVGIVSHCYQRKTVKDWPYNLFAMMHSRSMGEIQQVVNDFVGAEGVTSFELLPTAAELKKQPARYKF